MTVLICPVRPGDVNEELKYALRSWQDQLILPDGLELWTVGYKPKWLAPDRHIEGNRFDSMPLAVFDNVLHSAEVAVDAGVDEVIYMNDDFFCLDPVGLILPVRRNVSILKQVGSYPQNASTWWPRSLRLTASWLAEQGFPDPPSFEVHRPLLASSQGMVKALRRWTDQPDSMTDMVPQWRTVYGVLNEVKAYPVKDAKLGVKQTGVGTPWISTSDQTWRRYAIQIKGRFQKPSRWEV